MTAKLERLSTAIGAALGDKVASQAVALGELTVVVDSADYSAAAHILRDSPALRFEQLIDEAGPGVAAEHVGRQQRRLGMTLLEIFENGE